MDPSTCPGHHKVLLHHLELLGVASIPFLKLYLHFMVGLPKMVQGVGLSLPIGGLGTQMSVKGDVGHQPDVICEIYQLV